jgi:hypothetical protein
MSWRFVGEGNLARHLEMLQGLITAAPLTMCAWIWYPRILGVARTVVGLNAGSGVGDGWRIAISATGAAQFNVQATTTVAATTANLVNTSGWNFVAGVEVAANNHRVSMNGGAEGTHASSRVPSGVDRFFIGNAGVNGAIEAQIAEVAIWSRDLDYLTEILPMYLNRRSPMDVAEDDLLFYWCLRDMNLTGWRGHRLRVVQGATGGAVAAPSPYHHPPLLQSKVPIPLLAPQPRTFLPDPAVLDLLLASSRVNRLVRPDPVILDLMVPSIGIDRVIALTPAILDLISRRIAIGGFELPAFIVQLDPQNLSTKFDGTNAFVVFAADETDARAMVKAQLGGDANPAWDEATVSPILAGTDLSGWRLRVVILNSTPPLEAEVVGEPGDHVDDLGLAMAAALNATDLIDGASYTAGTQVLVVAAGSGADDLGDRTISVELRPPPPGAVPIPGGVVSIAHQGLATDDLSATLASDSFVIPAIAARAKIS